MKPIKIRKSQSKRAGILFPVSRISRYVKTAIIKKRVSRTVPVYVAAVLEYLSAEILELAGNAAFQHKKLRITPRHVFLAIANDEELFKLLKSVTIPQGGVIPRVHPQLLPKISTKVVSKVDNIDYFTSTTEKAKPKTKKRRSTNKKSSTKKKSIETISLDNFEVLVEKTLHLGQKLTILRGNIVELNTDVLLHFTDSDFNMTGKMGIFLQQRGGDELKKNIANLKVENGSLPLTEAALCLAPNIPAKYIIHSHIPKAKETDLASKLEKCIQNSLNLADRRSFRTFGLTSLSHVQMGISKENIAEIMVKAITNYFVSVNCSTLLHLYFVLFDEGNAKSVVAEVEKL